MKYKIYKVGGYVRDELLGLPSKDIDYTVVIQTKYDSALDAFHAFKEHLIAEGNTIYVETPETFTLRTTKIGETEIQDFVIARKEVYFPDSRTPKVFQADLYDDLRRRDFTVNAIALDDDNTYIDPFDGRSDITHKVLRTPIDSIISLNDDPLRYFRAMRFYITKGLRPDNSLWNAMLSYDINRFHIVSKERIQIELEKMFRHDTVGTIQLLEILDQYNIGLRKYLFDDIMWLLPTFKKK